MSIATTWLGTLATRDRGRGTAPGPATPPATVAASRGHPPSSIGLRGHRTISNRVEATVALRTSLGPSDAAWSPPPRAPGPDDEPAVVDPAADLPGVPIPRWFDASPETGTATATGTGTGSTGDAARWGLYAASAEGLGREILDFIAFVQPDATELRARYAALKRLETAGAEAIPAARAEPFGATAQRLVTHRGGLDARVRSSRADDATPERRGLERLAKALSARPWATDVSSSSSNRTVPSVSYVDVPTGLRVRACVGNRQTFRGSNFFDSPVTPLASRFPLWKPLMFPLKCFFEQRGLRAPFDGGLGAFRLGMMLLDYLSVHAPASTAPATPFALGAALIGFFRFFAGERPDEDAPGADAWQRWRENFRFDPMGMHVMGVRVDFGGCAAPDIARAFAAATRAATRVRVGVPSSSTALSRLLDESAVADRREVTRTAARRAEKDSEKDHESDAVTLPEAFLPVARWIEPTARDAIRARRRRSRRLTRTRATRAFGISGPRLASC